MTAAPVELHNLPFVSVSDSCIGIHWKINFEATLNFQYRTLYYFDEAFVGNEWTTKICGYGLDKHLKNSDVLLAAIFQDSLSDFSVCLSHPHLNAEFLY